VSPTSSLHVSSSTAEGQIVALVDVHEGLGVRVARRRGCRRKLTRRRFPDHHAGYMLDLIADLAFDDKGGGTLQPASKAALFQEFTLPDEQDDPAGAPPVEHTMESAEAALRLRKYPPVRERASDAEIDASHGRNRQRPCPLFASDRSGSSSVRVHFAVTDSAFV
jgi:hypothetical protein